MVSVKSDDNPNIIFYHDNITVILSSISIIIIEMSTQCNVGSKFKFRNADITVNANNTQICKATEILNKLHREFTEKYEPVPSSGSSVAAGKTAISSDMAKNPTFYLRKQPSFTGFPHPSGTGTEQAGSTTNRLYTILMNGKTGNDQVYRSAVHAITYGVYNPNITKEDYLKPPAGDTASPQDFNTSTQFTGIYGLKKVINLLEKMINDNIDAINPGNQQTSQDIDDVSKYIKRQRVKNTLEEIARRENELYREKFFNIFLVIVGIFLVSSQLVQKYFSLGGGGSSSGGFGFSNLFTGFGLGSGSGLFSRFGGLGLGRSGRSRWTSMFSNNPYALSTR